MTTNNGAGLNHSSNGAGNGAELNHSPSLTRLDNLTLSAETTPHTTLTTRSHSTGKAFEQPVLLQQSNIWSQAILWGLMGVTTTAIVWASVAKIEEAIPAAGKLEPQGTVKEVQAPVDGVVKGIYVDDGQRVRKGDRLVSLDPTAAKSQLALTA